MDEKAILKILWRLVRNLDDGWRLEGSLNLLVQGLSVSPKDIDLTMSRETLQQFAEMHAAQILRHEPTESLVVRVHLFGEEVEAKHYDNDSLNMLDKAVMVLWGGVRVPALPLTDALSFYEQIGRDEKVLLIRRHLRA